MDCAHRDSPVDAPGVPKYTLGLSNLSISAASPAGRAADTLPTCPKKSTPAGQASAEGEWDFARRDTV